jgi:hypothetical protein
MKKEERRKPVWCDSELEIAHRAKSIGILLNQDEELWHYLFHRKIPHRLRDEQEIFGKQFKSLSSEERVLVRASLDIWDSTGDLPLWECLWGLDYIVLIRLIRSICHLREIQLEAIQGVMTDYIRISE